MFFFQTYVLDFCSLLTQTCLVQLFDKKMFKASQGCVRLLGTQKRSQEHFKAMQSFDFVRHTPEVCTDLDTLPSKSNDALHRYLVLRLASIPVQIRNAALDDLIETRILAKVGSLQLKAVAQQDDVLHDAQVVEMQTIFSKLGNAQITRVPTNEHTDVAKFVGQNQLQKHGFLNSMVSWAQDMAWRLEHNTKRFTTALTEEELSMLQRSKVGVTVCNRCIFSDAPGNLRAPARVSLGGRRQLEM